MLLIIRKFNLLTVDLVNIQFHNDVLSYSLQVKP